MPPADSAAAGPVASLPWSASTTKDPGFVAFWTYVAILDGRISRDSDIAQVFWIQQRDTAAPVMMQRTNQLGGCVPVSAISQSVPPPPAMPAPLPALTETAIRAVAKNITVQPQGTSVTKLIAGGSADFVQLQSPAPVASAFSSEDSRSHPGC